MGKDRSQSYSTGEVRGRTDGRSEFPEFCAVCEARALLNAQVRYVFKYYNTVDRVMLPQRNGSKLIGVKKI